ncbi:general transcription factor IIIA, b [Salmo salar]|uniref:Transcription factor IIIA n=1 Tax=Salmo salar TaxID=8030 RepID=A0A1S3QAL0_SALSA|nr:general transcription factor IIIA, b [Salmo salar]|eukprot:XP_014036981.1 PREDICTED: transcription factor IIIA-like [Salmo salar]
MGERIQVHRSFICSFVNCNATFNKSWKLDAHLCKHTGLKPFSCENCDKSFCTRYQLTRHGLSHSGEKPYTCQAAGCSEAFVTYASMKNHMARVHQHQEKYYKCDHVHCGMEFNKKNQLKTHKIKHTQLLPFQCIFEGCKREFAAPGQLKRHEKVHQGYPCAVEDCPFQGKTWSEYQKHRKAVHRIELQCDSCSRMFLEAWFLKQHQLRVHSGAPKRVFQCSDAGCEKTFTTHFNLENHVVSDHEGKMAFSCTHEGCGKHFAMQESLRRHRVVHDPERKKLQKVHPKKRKPLLRKTELGTASTQVETSRLADQLHTASLGYSTS